MDNKGNENLIIIGASGHGKVVADIAIKMQCYKNIAFLDDDHSIKMALGLDIIGAISDVSKYKENSDIFIAIGNNKRREEILTQLKINGFNIPTLIHPSAIIGKAVEIKSGTAVMAGVVINCCSKIGEGCIINTGATIDHDNIIGDYVHISPGAHLAGTVRVGKSSWIGIGSVASNNVNITSGCIVGAGSVVVRDITEVGTYVGVPARRV